MDGCYPLGPSSVPEKLTRPSAAYKRHAWLAMGGLLLFVLLYFSLAGWFAWSGYRLIHQALLGQGNGLVLWVVGLCSAFLALFMIKALFFVKQGGESRDMEVTAQEEPRLFEFLHRLADEAGAPRPHRVFLSHRVNAAVFYDLSLFNLIFPSRKNLEIGLGLVNVLTLSELKAVLAHEFGHFGQKSMAVGTWVYVAQQIAAHIIAKRDALDKFLRVLSRIDLRVAWIGWLLTLIVWSLRALLETAFRLVIMAQRALSREMEFQADLVAVSMTGSDALIHALHRLQAADEAWDRAQRFAASELAEGRITRDIFALQLRVMECMAQVLNDPQYGKVPDVPAEQPERHRLFEAEVAQPPRMWATHPHSHEREENAKRVYVPAPLDNRSAWDVFADAAALRLNMSLNLLANDKAKPEEPAASLARLDRQYQQEYLNSRYRGAYLGRSVVRYAEKPEDLYYPDLDAALDELEKLYPETLSEELEKLRSLEREKALLEALRDGVYTAPGGVVRHRGRELQKRELPAAIEELRAECEQAQHSICDHDRRCRTAHRSIAARLKNGWEEYLVGLLEVLHYADHSEANLRDAQGFLSNVFAVITADGNVSGREVKRLLKAAEQVYAPLAAIYAQRGEVVLDTALVQALEIEGWQEGLGEFGLPAPTRGNINEWIQAIDGWINAAAGALSALRITTLERLLVVEAQLATHLQENTSPEAAPAPSRAPAQYHTLVPGSERERQKRLGLWDRFQTADGFFPALFRFAVSVSIVGSALALTALAGEVL